MTIISEEVVLSTLKQYRTTIRETGMRACDHLLVTTLTRARDNGNNSLSPVLCLSLFPFRSLPLTVCKLAYVLAYVHCVKADISFIVPLATVVRL